MHSNNHVMAYSCQPSRTKAYNEDLRWRKVWQGQAIGLKTAKIAENLGVDRSTVSRTLKLFNTTGTVAKKEYPKDKAYRKLSDYAEFLILNIVLQKPGIYI